MNSEHWNNLADDNSITYLFKQLKLKKLKNVTVSY